VKLNSRAFDHAKVLIKEGKFVADERDVWSEHQSSIETQNHDEELPGLTLAGILDRPLGPGRRLGVSVCRLADCVPHPVDDRGNRFGNHNSRPRLG
jgi:hypothetical protein